MSKILRSTKISIRHVDALQGRTSNVTHLVIAKDGLAARVTSHVCDIFI